MELKRFIVVSWCGKSIFIAGSYDTLDEAATMFRYRSNNPYHESPVILDAKQLSAAMVGRDVVAIGDFERFNVVTDPPITAD